MENEIQGSTILDGRYAITGQIGAGRVSTVYSAFDTRTGGKVVVKIISPLFVPGKRSFTYLQSLFQERLNVNHPNIVHLLGFGSCEGTAVTPSLYYVLEHREGISLFERINDRRHRPTNLREMISILSQVADGLSYLHALGIALSDLHPRRILLQSDGRVQLSAFGFVSSSQWLLDIAQHTAASAVDYRYLAPEMIADGAVCSGEAGADMYLFGILAYQLACGTVPFDANRDTLVQLHRHEDIPDTILQCNLPLWYDGLVRQCMAKNPRQRLSAVDVHQFLESKLADSNEDLTLVPAAADRSEIRVLFVEDNKLDQLSFARFAKSAHCQFTYHMAKTVENARQMLGEREVDVVVSDFMLPDGTGVDVIQAAGKIPTIVLTGAGREDVAALALRAGAFDYFSKDMRREHLAVLPQAVQRAFEWSTAEKLKSSMQQRIHQLQRWRLTSLAQSEIMNQVAEHLSAASRTLEQSAADDNRSETLRRQLAACRQELLNAALLTASERVCAAITEKEVRSSVHNALSSLKSSGIANPVEALIPAHCWEGRQICINQAHLELLILLLAEELASGGDGKRILHIAVDHRQLLGQSGKIESPERKIAVITFCLKEGGQPEAEHSGLMWPQTKSSPVAVDRSRLQIAKKLIEDADGIFVEDSAADGSSRFLVTFPFDNYETANSADGERSDEESHSCSDSYVS
jgi:serine/threonine-protein kinase